MLVAGAHVDRSFISVPLTAAVVTFSGIAAGFAVYKLLPWFQNISHPSFGVIILAASFGNVTYLGLPVITEMLGAPFGYVAIFYDLLSTTPILLTIGVFIAARYGSGEQVSFAAAIRRVLRLPPLWGVAAGIAVHAGNIAVPKIVLETAGLMGKTVIPIMTFTVGLALDFRDLRRLPIAIPSRSMASLLSLSPAVSTSRSGHRSVSITASSASRVVPGTSVTIARR